MRQTILSVALEVQPQSARRLSRLINALKLEEEVKAYSRLENGVPTLHFISMSIFEDQHFDPIFVIEANFDGASGPFWAQMEATLECHLRPMLRCCKRPSDDDGQLYDAITKEGSHYPLAPYFEARTVRPSAFHQGNRGLERADILRTGRLFLATRVELNKLGTSGKNAYRGLAAAQVHSTLRAALVNDFPWLSTRALPRIPLAERADDIAKLIGFLFLALFCLSIPGLALAPFIPALQFLVLFAVATLLVGGFIWRMRRPLTGEDLPNRSNEMPDALFIKNKVSLLTNLIGLLLAVATLLCTYILFASLIVSVASVHISGESYAAVLWPTVRVFALGLASAIFTIAAAVLWLRWLERRDSSQDAPSLDQRLLREMTQREDRISQNHMGSIVLVKPGVVRAVLLRAGHLGLHLFLRVIAINGYLGSMSTIHFAHWVFVNNGSRLMFFSNFDHSWESYLDDFIEKAHGGLTLAWGSCIGFPPTRFLVLDGARHGREFKAWARHSMAVTRFWFSAYKDYTVNQIERNARIADGLRKSSLTPEEAEIWARDL